MARNSLPVEMLTGQSNDGHRIGAWNVHVVREGNRSEADLREEEVYMIVRLLCIG